MKSSTVLSSTTQLPDPREADLVMTDAYERQIDLLRASVGNLYAVSEEQDLCHKRLKQENASLRKQLARLQEQDTPEVSALKVRIYAMREMLAMQGVTLANTDRAKMARYIAFMVGSSEKYVNRILEQDKPLAESHRADILRLRELASDINLTMSNFVD